VRGPGWLLRRELNGVEGYSTLAAGLRMLLAALPLGALSYAVWYGLDAALGRALLAQAVAVSAAIGAGLGAYAAAVWALRVPEARQIRRLLVSRRSSAG